MKANHTPGLWKLHLFTYPNGKLAGKPYIYAPPDLLLLAEHLADNPYLLTPDQWASEARAAIAKALGES